VRYCFGEKIRSVRERRKLTLKEVAERAGVSESMVSQIERNKVSPAIDTLLALSEALDLDLEYIFADYRRERSVRIVRSADRAVSSRPGVVYERLADVGGEGNGRFGIEAYLISLDPGAHTGYGEYGHPGYELGLVVEGTAELSVGSRSHELGAGDSASFQADAPHTLSNTGTKQLKMFWVVTPPRGDAAIESTAKPTSSGGEKKGGKKHG